MFISFFSIDEIISSALTNNSDKTLTNSSVLCSIRFFAFSIFLEESTYMIAFVVKIGSWGMMPM